MLGVFHQATSPDGLLSANNLGCDLNGLEFLANVRVHVPTSKHVIAFGLCVWLIFDFISVLLGVFKSISLRSFLWYYMCVDRSLVLHSFFLFSFSFLGMHNGLLFSSSSPGLFYVHTFLVGDHLGDVVDES